MFLNKKRLLLTLYRLEEGQQEIMERLYKLERGWKDSSGASHPQNDRNGAQNDTTCHPEERSDEGSWREGLQKDSSGINALRMTRGRPQNDKREAQNDTENPVDTWIIDGIEAILSYRRGKEEEK